MTVHREGSMYKELEHVIPPLPLLAVPSLGYSLSVATDLSSAVSNGTGIFVAVTIAYSCVSSHTFSSPSYLSDECDTL